MSHEIPQTTATYGRQKPRNINDLISTIENTDRELRATLSSNHPQPAPRVTSSPTNKLRRKNHRQRSTGNYRAPNGALRLGTIPTRILQRVSGVRKHRAPKGALRQGDVDSLGHEFTPPESTERQKAHYDDLDTDDVKVLIQLAQQAASAIRCIKTSPSR